ncbi:tetratricopeptide repeat protein [Deinococcus sp.]|uniref:tetratricopeptide repeat protein n=1 Tax=Deinococcus sp. TaxID=47478 RepID=UPI003CC66397
MTAQPTVPPHLEGLNLDWERFLRRGEYRRALAAARLGEADPQVAAAIEELLELQEAVRARRLLVARRSLERYRETLGQMPHAGVFREVAAAERLDAALAALEAADRQRLSDAASLSACLVPALDETLTRAEALNALGVLNALQDQEAEADTLFAQAVQHDPGHYRALTNLGNMALERGDPGVAEGLYRQAMALNGDYAGAHHNLGVALRRQKRLSESVKYIKAGQRLSVRQSKRDQDDELRASPRTLKTVQTVRTALIVLAVLAVVLLVRGHL